MSRSAPVHVEWKKPTVTLKARIMLLYCLHSGSHVDLAQFLRRMPFLTQPSPISAGLGPALHTWGWEWAVRGSNPGPRGRLPHQLSYSRGRHMV
ncbi:hypothetical protein EXN66_Car018885 [Channa argus]|uniref:Uncharacterized protein n=1 Tax=Channa argus TaxID=215402 RepID=A0A6G1QL53_CHAAH|nr:hypothetical protein EXN66_Car018885 [Channa argus]